MVSRSHQALFLVAVLCTCVFVDSASGGSCCGKANKNKEAKKSVSEVATQEVAVQTVSESSGSSGGCGMKPFFHTNYQGLYVLFEFWQIQSTTGYVVSMLVIFILGVLFEGLQALQRFNDNRIKDHSASFSNCTKVTRSSYSMIDELSRAFLHMARVFASLMLMLVFMTFEWGLSLALVVGAGVGFLVFARGPLQKGLPIQAGCH